MAPKDLPSLLKRLAVNPAVLCFDFPSSDGVPLEFLDDTDVMVVSVIGKSSLDCDWTKGLPLEELLSRKPRIPESWLQHDTSNASSTLINVRGIYDRKELLVILTLRTPVTDPEVLGRMGDGLQKRFSKDGFLPSWPTVNAEFHRAVLWLSSVSHVLIVVNDGDAFDASWVRTLLAVNTIREKTKDNLSDFLETFESCLDDDWIQNARLCPPRLLFYVHSNGLPSPATPNSSPHHGNRHLSRLADTLEDRIYKMFRKARVITNNAAHAVIALPSKERFVFVEAKKPEKEKKRGVSYCQRRGDLGQAFGWTQFADLVRNCESPSFEFELQKKKVEDRRRDDDDEDEEDELEYEKEKSRGRNYPTIQTKPRFPSYSFRDFVFTHLDIGFAGGFDDSVGRHAGPTFFVLPRFGTWMKIAKELHAFLLSEEANPKVKEVALNAVDTEMQYSEAKCEKVFPLAVAAYQESLPSHYNEAVHISRLSMAENLLIGQRTGPLCSKYLEDLRSECESIWKSGRQMCSEVSLRGNPCVNAVHSTLRDPKQERLPVMPHSSGFKFMSTCNCGRKQAHRDDPFTAREANITFYSKMADSCCKRRCHPYKLPKRKRRLSAGGDLTDVKPAIHRDELKRSEEGVARRTNAGVQEEQAVRGDGAASNVPAQAAAQLSLDFQRASLSQQSNESVTAQEIVAARERVARGLKSRVDPAHSSSDSPKFALTPSDAPPVDTKKGKVTRRLATQSSDASSEDLVEAEDEEEDEDELDDEDDERTEEMFRRLRLEDEEGEDDGRRGDSEEEEEQLKSKSLPGSSVPSPSLAGDDESQWSLVCLGPSSIYSHSCGIQDQPSFSSSSNFLMPWNVRIRVKDKERWLKAVQALQKQQQGLWAGKKSQNRQDQMENNEARIKIFVGMEYECPKGHRFMAAAPNRILRATKEAEKGGHVKETGKDVVEQDMPLYMNCSCRSEPIAVAQLMRIHVVTPKSPARVLLNPRVRLGPDSPEIPVFDFSGWSYRGSSDLSASCAGHEAGSEPVVLGPSKYWMLRLPYSYVDEERHTFFYPPKDGSNPGLRRGLLLKGVLGVSEPVYG